MLINVPQGFNKTKDVIKLGEIFKGNSYRYILSDIGNIQKSNTFELSGYGFYSHVYNVCDTYIFLIGNQIKSKDINVNSINFLDKVLDFEYILQNKPNQIKRIEIPNRVFTITSKDKWLQNDILKENAKLIDFIIKEQKTHLRAFKRPYERYLRYLADNENGMGISKYALTVNMIYDKHLLIKKYTDFDGYIIKYEHSSYL